MSYQTKVELSADKAITLGGEEGPRSIEGYYVGSKVTKDTGFGPGLLHIFQTSDGNVGIWGKSHMNSLLTEDHRGQMVLLSFVGMKAPTKKGRRPSYQYKLQYDKDNTIDVSNVSLEATSDDTEESEDGSYDEPQEQTYTTTKRTQPAAQQPTTEAQQRVQALLAKRK